MIYLTPPQFNKRLVFAFSDRLESKSFPNLPFSISGFSSCNQVHGNNVELVSKTSVNFSETDGLITSKKGMAIGVYVADCVAIYIYDLLTHSIAVVHAGWRGTLLNIAKTALEKMSKSFETKPQNCHAVISPAISACCYEVGNDVTGQFLSTFNYASKFILSRKNKQYLDLKGLNKMQLINLGLSDNNILVSSECTYCNSNFTSYRREGKKSGRHLALAVLLD